MITETTSLPSPSVSILVVSYNTCDMTLACLRSIYEQARSDAFEVIVVDNASTDGSPDHIESEFPNIRLIRSQDNLGFAKANNVAAEEARGEFVLLLNPDTVILDHAIDRLVEFAVDNPQAGIWGGRTVFEDGSLNPTSCWRFVSLWSIFSQTFGFTRFLKNSDLFNSEAYGGWQRNTVRQVDIITGCFLLISRERWRSLGGFDERFYMYSEEADLCYRARQAGARPLFTPSATIVHYGGASEAVLSAKLIKLFAGKITFLRKHWSPPRRALGIGLFKLLTFARRIGFSAVAVLTGRESHRTVAHEWWRTWSARNKWTKGYG